MKAQLGKVPVTSKANKVVAKAKPKAKPVAKAVAKVALKTASKGKVPVKPAVKLALKKAVKPPVKGSSQGKLAGKVKAAAKKVLSKPVAKPLVKSKSVTPANKQAPSLAQPKSNSKPAKKAESKSPIKTQTKAVPKTTQTSSPSKLALVVPESPLLAAVNPGVPMRAGRPSSRLAQLTVPSMAQSVASTAAKASYSQTNAVAPMIVMTPTAIKKDPKLANNWKTKSAEQLTDAELLAMPDSEYMNEKQLAAFRSKLVTLKNDMLSNAGETTEHLREDTVVVPDPADRATIEEEHALELRTRDRERKLLKKIEQSITRIDAGDYGFCDETGEPIGVGRLLARPTATLSLEAQQRRELKQKMFGD